MPPPHTQFPWKFTQFPNFSLPRNILLADSLGLRNIFVFGGNYELQNKQSQHTNKWSQFFSLRSLKFCVKVWIWVSLNFSWTGLSYPERLAPKRIPDLFKGTENLRYFCLVGWGLQKTDLEERILKWWAHWQILKQRRVSKKHSNFLHSISPRFYVLCWLPSWTIAWISFLIRLKRGTRTFYAAHCCLVFQHCTTSLRELFLWGGRLFLTVHG